ncbi:MAG TPA: 2-oxoacid:acceptor oxidoreductase subunit alpha [candidate division Zixibacteria bacterium]|nr:2-oxoacid:acceptor oxidoreductase subunit alpha [candidate division Zixibacteria bacterium]
MHPDLTLRIAGESGEGVITIGETLCKIAAREGLHLVTFRTFPAEIKGGPCMMQLRLSEKALSCHGERLDLLVCLNQQALDDNLEDLGEDGALVCEAECELPDEGAPRTVYRIPFERIAVREIGSRISKNIVVLGVLSHLLGLPKPAVEKLLSEKFARKNRAVLEHNLEALRRGLDYAREHCSGRKTIRLPPGGKQNKLLLSGNEAVALGAVAAGVKCFFGYPITPASEIMEWLALHLPRLGGKVLQTEDEIAAIGCLAGASWAGARSMTATSGPGLSLMSETIGLLTMAEIPAVIVDSQRGGPSTGMPTKTEQSDLNLALYGAHGDSPRVVVAPTSVADCFRMTGLAFDLAEKYQLPVIVLIDQALSARLETVEPGLVERKPAALRLLAEPAGGAAYARYRLGPAVSPAAVPGTEGGEHMVTGMEHDELGNFACDEEAHTAMSVKRHRKLEAINDDALVRDLSSHFGDPDADIGVVTWGSSAGPAEEAIAAANRMGIPVRGFVPRILSPLPHRDLAKFLGAVKRVIVPELNFTGQFAALLRATYGIRTTSLTKVKGVPLSPGEIVEKIVEAAEEIAARSKPTHGKAAGQRV